MRKTLFKKFLSLVLVLSIIIPFSNNAAALPMFTIHLLGIVDPDGADRTSWQTPVQNYLDNIPNSYFFKFTAFNSNQLYAMMYPADIFVIHTHGSQNSLKAVDASGNVSYLTSNDISSWPVGALDDIQLAFIGACECGAGGANANNLVNTIFAKGADCVIGYQQSVHTRANYIMIEEFCRGIGSGYTITEALTYADAQVLNLYGSSGNTNNRLVRGDTSTRFVDTGMILSIDPVTMSIDSTLDTFSINLDNYTFIERYYTEDTALWTTIYTYCIDGIETEDSVFIFHDSNGKFKTYMQPKANLFSGFQFDEDVLIKSYESLEAILKDQNIIGYEIVETRLVLVEENPMLRFSVKYSADSYDNTYQMVNDFFVPV